MSVLDPTDPAEFCPADQKLTSRLRTTVNAVAVFARNEAAHIAKGLDSVVRAHEVSGADRLRVVVLVNGTTDDTLTQVNAYAHAVNNDRITIETAELPIGDKCNAWNAYTHQLAQLDTPEAGIDKTVHFFMDGDCRADEQAFIRMRRKLESVKHAHAVVGVPLSGRNRKRYTKLLAERRWLYGNLYAVRDSFLQVVRDQAIRLPLGMRGNDCLLTRLMKTDLPHSSRTDGKFITYDRQAGYRFDSLRPWVPSDLKIYTNRLITYRHRLYQMPLIDRVPVTDWPQTMDAINLQILHILQDKPSWKQDWLDRQLYKRLQEQYGAFSSMSLAEFAASVKADSEQGHLSRQLAKAA